ncbi:hypothetical protein AB6D81_16415 [Vibrio splendidus]
MNVALCLHGLSGGVNYKHGGLPVTFESEVGLYIKNFVDINSSDIFIHSWSNEAEDKIISHYDPKAYLFERKKKFKSPSLKNYLRNAFNVAIGAPTELNRVNNIYSRWYSFKKVIEIAQEYEGVHNIKYDYFMVSRFDMSLFSQIDCKSLSRDKLIAAKWVGYRDRKGMILSEESIFSNKDCAFEYYRGFPHNDEGLLDFWFIIPRDFVYKIYDVFDYLDELIFSVGPSNHKIILEHINNKIGLEYIDFEFRAYQDFCLSRWT